jgi:hypothetical protein
MVPRGSKHGLFYIINNKDFEARTGMSTRTGTDVDASNLKALFTTIGYNVTLKNNLTAGQMLRLMCEAGDTDHSKYDSFGVAVLSHGEQGILFGTDDTIEVEKLINPIKQCKTLTGKPKLFFFQACRGTDLDEGQNLSDAEPEYAPGQEPKIYRIPMEADFLYAYSTTPGYFSWRNSQKGSWFVQALYKVLGEQWNKDIDLVRILTRVNRAVAYDFQSNAAQQHMNAKKQMPSIVSMLTKDLYFSK